jgi:hypothetical protein
VLFGLVFLHVLQLLLIGFTQHNLACGALANL